MNQQEMFDMKTVGRGKLWYVTYALPGFSAPSYYNYGHRIEAHKSRSEYLKEQGAALVFIDQNKSPMEIFKSIQSVPAISGLFRNQYWVSFYGQTAFVDNIPLLPAPYAKELDRPRPTHYGMRNGYRSFFWSARELARQCDRIEQFSDCAFCRHASDLGECLEVNTVRWARKNGIRADDVRIRTDRKDETTHSSVELGALLKAQCRDERLHFVSPGIVAGPFSTKLLYVNEVDLSNIESSIEDYKNRGTDAHSTRRAIKRCEEECYFHGHCGMCEKPYYGYPRKCQEGKAYNREDVSGPFSEYEVLAAARREVASWNPRPREDVALIARYGRSITKILGCETILRKMDSKMQNVEFIHERGGQTWTYSFRDAVEILRARYYEGGGYSPNRWHPERTPPMSDEDYLIYAELCQVNYVGTGGWGMRQPITYVEWDCKYGSKFEVGVRLNHYRRVDTLKRAGELADGWNCLSSIATAEAIKAVREEVDLETT